MKWVPAVLLAALLLAEVGTASRGWRYDRLDGIARSTALAIVGDDTVYAATYAADRFASISQGWSSARVVEVLGNPVQRVWDYKVRNGPVDRCCFIVLDAIGDTVLRSEFPDVPVGSAAKVVLNLHGKPYEESWFYAMVGTQPAEDRHFRVRIVVLRDGYVTQTRHYVDFD